MIPVCGVDTSSKGWAAVVLNGSPRTDHYFEQDRNPDVRRRMICKTFHRFLGTLPLGTMVFCEEPLALPKNGLTTRLLGLAAGALWAQHLNYNLTWFWVDVASWKREVIGAGGADKLKIATHFTDQGIVYKCLDLYDAHAIAIYGVRQLAAME